jgi:hypothetical protein
MSARAIVDAGDGSVTVRSIRYRAGSAPRWEAEVVLTTPAVRVLFALDREAVRNLRETLHEGTRGTIEGKIREFTPGVDGKTEGALALTARGLTFDSETVEVTVTLDDDVRDDLQTGLTDALQNPSVVEGGT